MKGKFRSVAEMREAIFKAKAIHRRRAARMPFRKKVEVLKQLQSMALAANPAFAGKWKGVLPWKV